MRDTLELFTKIITDPGEFAEKSKDKSLYILLLLIPFNGFILGSLYIMSHFYVTTFLHPIFWIIAPLVGTLLSSQLGVFLGVYLLLATICKDDKKSKSLRVLAFNFSIAYTLYLGLAAAVIFPFLFSHNWASAIYFYDISHVILNIWIAALCAQAIQKIREETEIRTLFKVFTSYFSAYGVGALLYLIFSAMLVVSIIR